MQRHYSTVGQTEMKEGLGRVISLAGFKAQKNQPAEGTMVWLVVCRQ